MLSWDESSIYHAERKVTAVRFSKWHIAPEKPEAQACLRAAGYPYLVAAVLSARGIETPEQAAAFLEREDKLTISPFLMRDMDKAAARVQQAIAGGERIAVFGDYCNVTRSVSKTTEIERRGGNRWDKPKKAEKSRDCGGGKF